jgi:hypothetical protein
MSELQKLDLFGHKEKCRLCLTFRGSETEEAEFEVVDGEEDLRYEEN